MCAMTEKQAKRYYELIENKEQGHYCQQCGEKIKTFYHGGRLNPSKAAYCSYKCQELAALERRKERRAEGRERKCLNCGKVFTPARNDAKYCCNACKQEAYRTRKTVNAD